MIVFVVARVISEKKYSNFFHGVIFMSATAIIMGWLWKIPEVRVWFMTSYGDVFHFFAQYHSVIAPIIAPITALYGQVAH